MQTRGGWKKLQKNTRKKNGRSFSVSKKLIRAFVIFLVVGIMSGTIFLVALFSYVGRNLPNPGQVIARDVPETTKIFDRTGEHLLYEIHGDQKRTLVKLADIPKNIQLATLVAEDRDFYNHPGFDLKGIFRATIYNIFRNKGLQGGSTITQQFIKNAILTNERTLTRKAKELILSYQIEKKFSKDEILELYLNEIPYGSNTYGVEAASNTYFGKDVQDLSLAESATLAGIPKAPKYLSPLSASFDSERLKGRQRFILDGLVEEGYISKEAAESAKKETLVFQRKRENILAPHFIFWVREQLEERYGSHSVDQGGLKIITTLDVSKQEKAEKTITDMAEKNASAWNANNASLVSLDPKTGEVLSMVGSRDYFNEEIDGAVNVALSSRQPGSSIKPLIYAAAFEKGYTPETTIFDVETTFRTDVGPKGSYTPKNYNGKVHGPVNMRNALQGSLNIPAVKTLYLVGLQSAIDFLERFGYTTFSDRSRFGLSLVLGGGEIKLIEHVRAFATFAREGISPEIVSILRVEDHDGKILEEWKKPETKKILDEEIAREINNVLSDNSARSFIFGNNSSLQLGERPVAAKTGTTSDNKDAWILGYTPSLVTGVWVGNSNGDPMKAGADGSVVAGPIWNTYMHSILDGTPIETFKEPKPLPEDIPPILLGKGVGEILLKVDKFTGKLATKYTPDDQIEEKAYREYHSILYYVEKDAPKNGAPKNPEADPEFAGWEEGVARYVVEQKLPTDIPPTESSELFSPANQPTIYFVSPQPDTIFSDRHLNIDITTVAPRGVARVEYYFDNTFLTNISAAPFDLTNFVIPNSFENGFYVLRAISFDDIGNRNSAELSISLNAPKLPVSLSWKTPTGTSLNSNNLPFTLTTFISDPSNINQVDFFLKKKNTREIKRFYSSFEITSKEVEGILSADIASGKYEIFYEIFYPDGSSQKSENISITIE